MKVRSRGPKSNEPLYPSPPSGVSANSVPTQGSERAKSRGNAREGRKARERGAPFSKSLDVVARSRRACFSRSRPVSV